MSHILLWLFVSLLPPRTVYKGFNWPLLSRSRIKIVGFPRSPTTQISRVEMTPKKVQAFVRRADLGSTEELGDDLLGVLDTPKPYSEQ